jgi:hypothetical protein
MFLVNYCLSKCREQVYDILLRFMLACFLSRINDTMQETSLVALSSGGIDHACTKYWTVWPELSFADSEFSQRPLPEARMQRSRLVS